MKTSPLTTRVQPSVLTFLYPSARWCGLSFVALILALCVYPAAAATLFWDGSGSSWSAVGSWSTSFTATTPDPLAVPGFADTALFNIGTVNSAQTIYLGGNQAVSSLIFSNTSPTTFLGGSAGSPAANTLILGTNGGALTIASVTAAAGNVTIGDTTGGGANVTPTLAGATNNIITVAAGRILNFANGLNFNTGKIQNNGAGTLVLNAAGSGAGLLSTVGATNYNIIARLDSGTVTLGSPTAFGTGVIDTRNETLQANTDLSGANKILNTFVLATGTTVIGGSTNLELGAHPHTCGRRRLDDHQWRGFQLYRRRGHGRRVDENGGGIAHPFRRQQRLLWHHHHWCIWRRSGASCGGDAGAGHWDDCV